MGFFRVVKDKSNPYVMMNKYALEDESISWKAKGILAYLLSLPDDWKIYESELKRHAKDGIDSLAAGIKELEKAGYVVKTKSRNKKGQITGTNYEVFEVPTETGKSKTGKPVLGKTDSGKSKTTNIHSINNKENNTYISLEENGCNSFLRTYLDLFYGHFGEDHMKVTPEQLRYIHQAIDTLVSYDISLKEWEEQVIQHFRQLPARNNGNILAFLKAGFRYFNIDLERMM